MAIQSLRERRSRHLRESRHNQRGPAEPIRAHRLSDADNRDPRAERRLDPTWRVLERDARAGVNTERRRRLEVPLRVRLADTDILDSDNRTKTPAQPVTLESRLDLDPPSRAAHPKRHIPRKILHQARRPLAERHPTLERNPLIRLVLGDSHPRERGRIEHTPAVSRDLGIAVDIRKPNPPRQKLLDRELDPRKRKPRSGREGVHRLRIDERPVKVEDHGLRRGGDHTRSVAAACAPNLVHSPQ